MKKILIVFVFNLLLLNLFGQVHIKPEDIKDKMQWFGDAKLGIFIHAGIYSVDGVTESWSFFNKRISFDNYMKQAKGFTLKNYDPKSWADLIEESGAKYVVFTSKHHDGVAMYNTKINDVSIVKKTPAKRDMISPLFTELKKKNVKCGLYYSLLDWSHVDYPAFLSDSSRYQIADDYQRWNKFRNFLHSQIIEILHEFNPDLWWFDGDWEHSAEEWEAEKIRNIILKYNPNTIINGRLQGWGDYATPEQNIPVVRPKFNWWELCMTINGSWGFQHKDLNFKSPYEIITIFVDVIANGGNLLLDFGPREDGTIPQESVNVLKELGAWNKKHQEAIFSTVPGFPPGHFYGPSTVTKDSLNLFLFLAGNPQNKITIRGLMSDIDEITVLGTNDKVDFKILGKIDWSEVPGLVYIDAPKSSQLDKYMTVYKIKLKSPLKLYRGHGGFYID